MPLTIVNNYFTNIANPMNHGGAIALLDSGFVKISDNTFSNVSARVGGAVYWNKERPQITHNLFENCSASVYGNQYASYGVKLSFISV